MSLRLTQFLELKGQLSCINSPPSLLFMAMQRLKKKKNQKKMDFEVNKDKKTYLLNKQKRGVAISVQIR